VQDRLDSEIDALADDPKPPGSAKLRGYASSWRVRVGDYRIIYEVDETTKKVSLPAWRIGGRLTVEALPGRML